MAASASTPSLIDVHQPGEYPIILGDSLKDESRKDPRYLALRYNWTPQNGFKNLPGTLNRHNDDIDLVLKGNDKQYRYKGWEADQGDYDTQDSQSRLALVFDETKSAFVLERLSTCINLNLESATNQSTDKISKYRQLPRPPNSEPSKNASGSRSHSDHDDDTPDSSNPFDFRHFLSEAREAMEKSSHTAGNKTPVPGGRTPLSGLSSPMPHSGKFLSTTPQFRPIPVAGKKATPDVSKKKATTAESRKGPTPKSKEKQSKQPQPLSKERISDSDESLSDVPLVETIARAPKSGGHKRNVSANIGRSPHIIVNDGGLEIDMGSPPPEARPRSRIDPEAFRSQTGTPTFGRSSNRPKINSEPVRDVEMKDSTPSDEDEERGSNGDVEELELGSPEHGKRSKKKEDSTKGLTPPKYKPRSPSSLPQAQAAQQAPEDDDDDLAAELVAAMEQEDDSGIGLGINTGGDDESEISEEE